MINNTIQINPNLLVERQLLTFLLNSDDRISKLLIGIETCDEIFYLQNSGSTDMISYIPKSKIVMGIKFEASNYKLQNMKIGRIVSKLFNKEKISELKLLSSEIEYFVNSYKSWFEKNMLGFKIVTGNEIRQWYDLENYSTISKGTLWNSCMRYKNKLKFLDLYCKNPNIKMLILTSMEDGVEKLRGRALIWDEVIINNHFNNPQKDIKIMDRIYSILDSDVILFKNWAYDNGYIHKLEQNAKSHLYFFDKCEILKLSVTIKLEKLDFGYYPYLDTFPYFCQHSSYLTNDNLNIDWDYKLTQANGNLMSDEDMANQENYDNYDDEY